MCRLLLLLAVALMGMAASDIHSPRRMDYVFEASDAVDTLATAGRTSAAQLEKRTRHDYRRNDHSYKHDETERRRRYGRRRDDLAVEVHRSHLSKALRAEDETERAPAAAQPGWSGSALGLAERVLGGEEPVVNWLLRFGLLALVTQGMALPVSVAATAAAMATSVAFISDYNQGDGR
jgi:hypothetical protein